MKTQRLELKPLTATELHMYLQPAHAFEQQHGYAYSERSMSNALGHLLESMTVPALQADPATGLFITIWLGIDRDLNTIVAEAGFKGVPDHKGEIEIGYATVPSLQRCGYATEMVGGMLAWASKMPGVKTVLAETDKANFASQAVLEKNGFVQTHAVGDMLWWRWIKKP